MTDIEKLQKQIDSLKRALCSTNEILISNVGLSGVVPSCYKFGINTTTGQTYYKNSSGNWAPTV